MRRLRTLSTVAATIVTGMVLAACTATPGVPDADGAARTTATVVVFQDLNSIDPAQGVDQNSANAMHNFFEGLFRLDERNLPVSAGAAALPEVSDDGLVYTIRLNPASVWSDGTPVTAHDYVFAWQRALGLPNAAEHQRTLGFLRGADEIMAGDADPSELGVVALDDLTLQVTLRAPAAFFPSLLATPAFFPVPEHFVTAQGDAFATTSDHVLFNGPFALEGFAGAGIGGDWAYVRNEQYWNAEAVALERVDVCVIRETTTAVNLFTAGEVDQVVISGPQVQAHRDSDAFVVDTTATVGFLGYNHDHPVLADQRAREAISLAIDREALTERVLADGSTPATGLVPPGLATSPAGTDFAADAGDLLRTDVARAAELWEQVRADHGFTELTLSLETFDADRIATVAEYLQNALESALDGLSVTVTTNPVGVFLDKTGRQAFDLYLPTWAATFPDPSSHLTLFGTGESTNWGRYSNPELDALLAAAQTTNAADPQARWADLLAAQEVLVADQGVTPIYFQPSTLLRTPSFRGVEFRTSGPAFFFGNAYFA
ncbi:4-phytase [Xylanimonas cellulosilytica DSM 15894]|uniref:4-phytase n=1 Tax=Xylanimonas cellulosilytica (strain DSM 15894 / JCM 12276 / CECT 5975 / KCTC 9989 / LMG 20990 / NBRC 107835 / XIL07) TaxID=446471 RepID=D1BT29_XYLCX|nr:peptide ABC transporter substrate-binding protein [Xylanimonas cellulosilytica]ACZ30871.1 4-phytase [Xylanimonas cellulosilytica DSM 15894]